MGAPPGGPLRTTPPELLRVTPDSGAVNVRARSVVFHFDVVVSDKGPSGELDNLFLISPREGTPRVTWRRDRIEVRPRRGFRPNTAYAVALLPGLSDLRGNAMLAGRTVVFSTGPTLPAYAIHGRVFDWMSERVAPNALIDVIRRPDSLPYVGTADSSGQFAVGPLDEGTYTVRALLDNNKNRAVDPGEAWDSVTVVVKGSSPFLELLAATRDTIPPRLLIVTAPDTLTLAASFDRPLDPGVPRTPESFRVVDADSAALRIVRVQSRAEAAAAATARRDTTARADSARGRPDSVPSPQPALPAQLKPSRPAPPRDLVIRLDSLTPLRRGATYRVTALNARGLLGRTRVSDRIITVPPGARADSTAPARPGAPRP